MERLQAAIEKARQQREQRVVVGRFMGAKEEKAVPYTLRFCRTCQRASVTLASPTSAAATAPSPWPSP